MKFAALHQFYLDYVFPRKPNSNRMYGLRCQLDSHDVTVRARDDDEELFPNPIDKTLSTMHVTLRRVTAPSGSFERTVEHTCFDRIESIVRGEISEIAEVKRADFQERIKEIAVRACNIFLEHSRVVARSPFIIPIERHYRFEDGRYYLLRPHTLAWFDAETEELIPAYEGGVNGICSSGAIPSPERGGLDPDALQRSFLGGREPDLVWSLLTDARERVVTIRLREAILCMSVACEVASNQQIARLGGETKSIKAVLRNKSLSFAERRFVQVPSLLGQGSLRDTDLATFEELERTYKCRNSVAHVGRAIYQEKGGTVVEVDLPLALRFLTSAEIACEWLAGRG